MNNIVEQLETRRLLASITNGLVGDEAILANVERGGIVTSVDYGAFGDVMFRYEAFLDLGDTRSVWGSTERVVAFGAQLFDTQFSFNGLGDVTAFTHRGFGASRPITGDLNRRESDAVIWLDDANDNDRPDDGSIRITATTTLTPGGSFIETLYSFATIDFDLAQARFFQYQDADLGILSDNVLIVQGNFNQNSLILQTVDPAEFVWVGQQDNWQRDAGASLSGFAADEYDELITSILEGGFRPAPNGTIANLPPALFPGLGNGFGSADVTTALAYDFERRTDVNIATRITLFAATDVPVMQVFGKGVFIPDGSVTRSPVNGTDFGLSSSFPVQQVFEIHNQGRQPLVFADMPAIQVTGANPEDFQVIRQPTPRVAEAGTALFTIQFIPSGSGTRTATISIDSNDLATTPYTFSVFGGSGTTIQTDVYEPDGDGIILSHKYFDGQVTPGLAKVVSTAGVWKVHSIHRNDDVDWSVFELTEETDVLIQTTAPLGDTRIYVYDSLGQQVGYDNDSGAGLSAALYLHLRPGVYYTRVDEYGNNATIPLYGLSVVARPGVQLSDSPIYLDGAGRLFVYGTAAGDTIAVDVFSGAVRVALNDSQVFFPLTDVRSVFVNGRDGADTIYVGVGIVGADIRGSRGSDAITVDSDSNSTIFGGSGIDVIFGGLGNDYINGKKGNDLLFGGAGNDYIQGGDGDDAIEGGDGDDILLGYWGNDLLMGQAGNDVLIGGPDELPPGKTDDDRLFGGDGNDTLRGGPGRDEIFADAGNNTISAIDGEVDTISGDELADIIGRDDSDIFKNSNSVLA